MTSVSHMYLLGQCFREKSFHSLQSLFTAIAERLRAMNTFGKGSSPLCVPYNEAIVSVHCFIGCFKDDLEQLFLSFVLLESGVVTITSQNQSCAHLWSVYDPFCQTLKIRGLVSKVGFVIMLLHLIKVLSTGTNDTTDTMDTLNKALFLFFFFECARFFKHVWYHLRRGRAWYWTASTCCQLCHLYVPASSIIKQCGKGRHWSQMNIADCEIKYLKLEYGLWLLHKPK